MRAALFAIALAACGQRAPADPVARCREVVNRPLRRIGPIDAIDGCRDLLRPACARAMAAATPATGPDERVAILAACARAYCPVAGQPLCGDRPGRRDAMEGGEALATLAFAEVHALDPEDARAAASLVAGELAPVRAAVVRFAAAGDHVHVTIDGGGAWDVPARPAASDFAPLVAALRASDADLAGAVVWGSQDVAPEVRDALFAATRDTHMPFVVCARDGANCR